MRKIITFSVLALALAFSLAAVVYASSPPITLSDGYEIITNYHGVDVMVGTPVTAIAMTIDPAVTQVTFLWKNPGSATMYTDVVPVYTNGTTGSGSVKGTSYTDVLVKFANATEIPDEIGDWGVQALFQDSGGKTIEGVENVLAIRARSFNVIPEIPVIGTLGASIAMVAGFAYKMKRKPQK
jgi:hypothetical protein